MPVGIWAFSTPNTYSPEMEKPVTSVSSENKACQYVAALLSLKQVSAAEKAMKALASSGALSPENVSRYRSLINAAKSSHKFS
jgi:hypothetical protein